ncbi:hypothetical protein B0H19DRAFT_1095406 [Mycena capillaripes]|nr:hypothetical protein B0H19DRAFT_1095406 [Mycena capillaripes]
MKGLPNFDDFSKAIIEDPGALRDRHYIFGYIQTTISNSRDIFLDKIDLEQLKVENARLKHTNNILSLKLGTYCRSNYAALPHKILLIVFLNVLPPRWLLSGTQSLDAYPQVIPSVALRMKLSILSVCKSWDQVGTGLLYERVVLRRISQLPVFVRTIEGREGLGALVKHLDVDCFVPRGYSKLLGSETKRIIELCPNLSHVRLSPPFWIPELPCSLPAMSDSIISLSSSIPYSAILPSLMQLSYNLKSLVITIPAAYDDSHPVLAFDRLEDLCLKIEENSAVSVSKWRIPHLRRLRLDMCLPHYNYRVAEAYILRCRQQTTVILDAYGPTITSLRLPHLDDRASTHLQESLNRCPILEHLVLYNHPGSATHKTIKLIDFFTLREDPPPLNMFDSPANPSLTVKALKGTFPALRGCRNLDVRMSHFRDLPPQHGDGDDGNESEEQEGATEEDEDVSEDKQEDEAVTVLLEFTHPSSVYGGAFIRNDISDDYVLLEDDVEGSDTSDSDTGTISEDLEDEFYLGDDWEVAHDEALTIVY